MGESGNRLCMAGYIDVDGRRRIWLPPTGRPYWIGVRPYNAGPDLTDKEMAKYGLGGE
ncbi:MAG: hypothetical protein WC455_25805 [Dehalococcoidia bacterium]|jgi:hypothetical protein